MNKQITVTCSTIKTALPGLLDKDDQVRYMMYMLTKDDCSKPDLMFTVHTIPYITFTEKLHLILDQRVHCITHVTFTETTLNIRTVAHNLLTPCIVFYV